MANEHGLSPELLKKLTETFHEELNEQRQIITDGLLQLEKIHPSKEKRELLSAVFRAAHNIKGSAFGLGAEKVAEMAHRLESVFGRLQKKELNLSPELIDLALDTLDILPELFQYHSKDSEQVPSTMTALVAQLDNLIDQEKVSPPKTSP
ncbi:Hpt domain-containing protein, partial [Magnetococcales bacterium HHB-1]